MQKPGTIPSSRAAAGTPAAQRELASQILSSLVDGNGAMRLNKTEEETNEFG